MQHLYTKTKYKSRKVFNNSLTKNLINCIFPVATAFVAKLICAKKNLPCLHYEITKIRKCVHKQCDYLLRFYVHVPRQFCFPFSWSNVDFVRELTLPQKCFVINIAMYNNAKKSQLTFVLYRLISFSKLTLVLYLYCTMLKCCTVKNIIGKKTSPMWSQKLS